MPTRRSKRILGSVGKKMLCVRTRARVRVCVCVARVYVCLYVCACVYLEDASNTSADDNPMRGSWQMGKKLTRKTFSSIGRCKQNKQKKIIHIHFCVCVYVQYIYEYKYSQGTTMDGGWDSVNIFECDWFVVVVGGWNGWAAMFVSRALAHDW